MIKQVIKKTIDLGDGRTITIETGKLAKQADGAVEVRMGNTMLLATVCSAQEAGEGVDFMPLQVEYKERFSAFGRFPGGFTKREGRASDYEILTSRLVDRVLRPLFPENYHADTFVNIMLFSSDGVDMPDALAGLAASAASVIAMAGTKVLMSPVAMMMIHNPATIAIGDTAEMKKAIEMLDEVKESIMNAYEIKTGLNRTKISHLMDAESWFNAKKAVELGFADEILFDKEKEENPEEKKEEKEEELEAILFSRSAVTNSFFNKLISGKPEKKVNISELEKRLSLLKP